MCLEGEDDQEQDRHGEGHGLAGVSFEIGDQACGHRAGCRIGHPCECADAFGGLGRTVCADGEPFMPQTPSAYGEADDPCDGKDGDAGDQHRPSSGKRVERQLEGRTERRPCGDGGRRAPGLGVEAEGYAGVDQNVRQLADDDESQHDEDVERAFAAFAGHQRGG